MENMDKIDQLLTRGIEEIYPSRESLEKLLRSGKKLRIYNGIDPTNPNIHLGNAIPLWKLRQFQDLGHQVILLIGDFTARIGDPSDKTATRRQLTHQEVLKNAKTYKEQAAKILDFKSNNPPEVKFNSHWLDKLSNKEVVELAACFTVQQMIERDLFQKRIEEKKPIGLHEFLYPLYQGYDSVMMDVDIEVGGREQTFNMLAGRNLMKTYKNKEKYVMTNPWLPGTDGRKMSKSWGNVINVTDSPQDMYGKIMSVSDKMIVIYFELCTNLSLEEIEEVEELLKSQTENPMVLKKKLAREIVTIYHSASDAQKAEEEFEKVTQKGGLPSSVETIELSKTFLSTATITDALVISGLAASRSEAKRLITQGGTAVAEEIITDPNAPFNVEDGTVIRAGKRKFVKIRVGSP